MDFKDFRFLPMSTQANDKEIGRDPNPEKTFFENRFHRLGESDINSDCEFIVGPKKTIIKGHKLIFSAASEVFNAMFYGLLKEDKPVIVEDLTAEGFEGMKTFIYAGKISFKSAKQALLTYIAARKYLVPLLSNVCTDFIKNNLKSSEVLEFCDICRLNCISEFNRTCRKIIQEKTDEVVDSEYFIHSEPETIELILKSPALKLRSEIEVFEHFERWALVEIERKEISANEVASSFNNLKKLIRFFSMNGDEFVSRVGESVLLTHEEKHAIAFNKLKLSSKPMPDSITLIEEPRKFNLPPSVYHQHSHRFLISIEVANSPNQGFPIAGHNPNNNTSIMSVFCEYQNGFISFKLCTCYYSIKAMFIVKSKFRVFAINECDDLVIENEIKDFVNSQSSQINKTIYLAMIPVNKVHNERFLKSVSSKVINIEGTFKVERINLA